VIDGCNVSNPSVDEMACNSLNKPLIPFSRPNAAISKAPLTLASTTWIKSPTRFCTVSGRIRRLWAVNSADDRSGLF
jgi:hypothetical protein